mmetsp:Transcript_2997/g.6745  ORF Transcript_2997/g.6745 Transcript_2997/m.6745 type:complete len:446 (-) Transcript_2997:187-1524(-)|eukprot:CAMPEP_0113465280 /NCGR_PEP_ID=MMETSP0014_2-20120614/13654_1 /TAXON_ID=2857 /ORGANISM="Nitzschia sp." /LENGTH=445 /DNA_ID=CAMNT_0000357425 /DNA_START=208 /DNA_END=1545 /DNA_ORIENTATION=- /assembly_acc=CAM_ASM_000159
MWFVLRDQAQVPPYRGPKAFRPKHLHHHHRRNLPFLRGSGGLVGEGGRRFGAHGCHGHHGHHGGGMPYHHIVTMDDIVAFDGNEPLHHHTGVLHYHPPPHFHRHHPHHPYQQVGFGWSAIDRNPYDSTDSSASGDDDEHGHMDVIVIDLTGTGTCSGTSHGRADNTEANNKTNLRGGKVNHCQQNHRRQVGINVSSSPDQSDTKSCTSSASTAPSIAFLAVGPNGAVGVPICKQTDMDMSPTKVTKAKEEETTHTGKYGENTEEVNSKNADDKITHSKTSAANPQSQGNDSTKCPPKVAATAATAARSTTTTTSNKTFHVRTPAHHDETSTHATISFDVSGFTMDQLEIRIVVDDEKDRCKSFAAASNSNNNENNNNNNILLLKVSGKRHNSIGDEFVIDRKFALKRDQLATPDIDKLQIEANMSESDGILTIRVPKNEKKKNQN